MCLKSGTSGILWRGGQGSRLSSRRCTIWCLAAANVVCRAPLFKTVLWAPLFDAWNESYQIRLSISTVNTISRGTCSLEAVGCAANVCSWVVPQMFTWRTSLWTRVPSLWTDGRADTRLMEPSLCLGILHCFHALKLCSMWRYSPEHLVRHVGIVLGWGSCPS